MEEVIKENEIAEDEIKDNSWNSFLCVWSGNESCYTFRWKS